MNKKIVFFINRLSGGGAEKVCITLIEEMRERGMDVELVVLNLEGASYSILDVPITNLDVKSIKYSVFKIKEYLENNKFDIAMVFSYEISIILMMLKKMKKLNYIVVSRCINTISKEREYETSKFRKYIVHSLIKALYKKVDYIISQSNGMTKDLENNYNVSAEKIYTVNNPLSNRFEEILNSNLNMNFKSNIKGFRYLLYVGRLEQQKGIFYLIESFSKLNCKDVKLLLVGSGSQEDDLKSYCKKLGVESNVEFLKFCKDIDEFYLKASVTLLSSYFEGFPNVLLESIACGTPVVSFNCPSGPDEIIIDGINGFLAEYMNVNDLSLKIDKALNTKWDRENIRKTAERYKKNTIVNKYIDILTKI